MAPELTPREIAWKLIDLLATLPDGKVLNVSVEPVSGTTVDSLAAVLSILAREQHMEISIDCGMSCLRIIKTPCKPDGPTCGE